MFKKSIFIALAISITHVEAQETDVNAAQPTIRRVIVNPIQTVKEDGTRATVWGDDRTVEFYIKGQIQRILNQSGVDVQFNPVIEMVSDFAYDGSPNDYSSTTRPSEDLGNIVDLVESPLSTDTEVINCFFVEVVPQFTQLTDDSSNGLAYVGGNGIAMHCGNNFFGSQANRNTLARVIAHEIGHNLGLSHTGNGITNLMSPGGTTGRLTASQTTEVLNDTPFAKPLADTDYASWVTSSGVIGGQTADDDNDGYSNVFEYVFGMDPKYSDLGRAPKAVLATNGDITIRANKLASAIDEGFNYVVEVSDDLSNWDNAGTVGSDSVSLVNNSNELAGSINTSSNGKKFIRLSANQTAASLFTVRNSSYYIEDKKLEAVKQKALTARVLSDCGENGCGHIELIAAE